MSTKHSNDSPPTDSSPVKTEYCHICDKDFPTSAHEMPNFKFHIVTVHGNIGVVSDNDTNDVTGIECKECLKKFSTKVGSLSYKFGKFSLI